MAAPRGNARVNSGLIQGRLNPALRDMLILSEALSHIFPLPWWEGMKGRGNVQRLYTRYLSRAHSCARYGKEIVQAPKKFGGSL